MTEPVSKDRKLEHPAEHYRTPADIANDNCLSLEEKKQALNTWEQDARQLLTASGEGMAGSKEGVRPADHHRLGEVIRAKEEIGQKPKHKASQ
jgi:hypothetical protein